MLSKAFGKPSPTLVVVLLQMCENDTATGAFDVKLREANAVVRRSAGRNGGSNLYDGKNMVVFGQAAGFLPLTSGTFWSHSLVSALMTPSDCTLPATVVSSPVT
jgi:hypothetical protein